MIAFVRGSLHAYDQESMIVDTGAIGYHLLVAGAAFAEQPRVGEEIFLHTYLQVREDGMQLFGFSNPEQLEVFRHLLSVSGIGAKLALAVLNTLSVREIIQSVVGGDAERLSLVPGIGRKTAQRMILELKEKFKKMSDGQTAAAALPERETMDSSDAILALTGLGYSGGEARSACHRVLQVLGPQASTQEIIKGALKLMARI